MPSRKGSHGLANLIALNATTFWLQKEGNAENEYEDAFALNRFTGRFAIADGATEAAFARMWAGLLVDASVSSPLRNVKDLEEWLQPSQQLWHDRIDWANLPWFSIDKARRGALAAFLQLQLLAKEKRTGYRAPSPRRIADSICQWRALAVGDSCLFHVRNGSLVRSFPLTMADQFTNRPVLLSSQPAYNTEAVKEVQVAQGNVEPQDAFILATDALAQWILRVLEMGEEPFHVLARLDSQEMFEEWISTLRRDEMIRNDDVTVVIVHAMA
jgi:hypothetical protein